FNGRPTNQALFESSSIFDQSFDYTRKIGHKKVIGFSGRYIHDKSPQNLETDHFYFSDLFPEQAEIDSVRQFGENSMDFIGGKFYFMERSQKNHLFKVELGSKNRIDKLSSRFFLFDEQNMPYNPPDYQNEFSLSTHDIYAKTKLKLSFGRFSVIPKLALHGLWAGTKTFDDKTSHTYFYLRPGIGIDWDINKNNSLRLNYSYNHKNSRVLDNYPNFALRNFRFLS